MINIDFRDFIWTGVIIGFVVCMLIWIPVHYILTPANEIKSETPIQPRIELIIKDNKVDTIYIYNND